MDLNWGGGNNKNDLSNDTWRVALQLITCSTLQKILLRGGVLVLLACFGNIFPAIMICATHALSVSNRV